MANFLLVPGACHGGWYFEPLAERLRAEGHAARALTLPGLAPGSDLTALPPINLDTHVAEVVAAIDALGSDGVVLLGHSYAGSVITGAADQRADSVTALLYVDAFVPSDGDSCWTMTSDVQREWYSTGCGATGLGVEPLPFFDERAVAQPLGTFMQRSRLTGAWQRVPRKHFIVATAARWVPESPFLPVADRLRDDPDWQVMDFTCGHNVADYAFDDLLAAALAIAA